MENKFKLNCGNMTAEISKDSGNILSYRINGEEILSHVRPVFTAQLLNVDGTTSKLYSSDSRVTSFTEKTDRAEIEFLSNDGSFSAHVSIFAQNGEIHWHIATDNNTGLGMEWLEFPGIAVKNDLIGEGGESTIFWPALEGQEVTDVKLREAHWAHYTEIGNQTGTYGGYYPGSCPMQFMAYYNPRLGFYFAAHDSEHNPKTVEYHREGDGIVLEYRLFTSDAVGKFDCGYDMVTSSFTGTWYDAADIYRSWMEKNCVLPEKLCRDKNLPEWFKDSPIVLVYPVRGTKDTGDMTPNCYFPYSNALPHIKKLSEDLGSRVMALLAHWEGTAPWAPPYVWPPFGGEEILESFADSLHEDNNLLGLYCSGIGWTTESILDPTYDPTDKYEENLMCKTRVQTIEQSKVLGYPIRYGYDMCPYSERVGEIVANEIISMAKAGCDYAQYFDQNLGGAASLCYAKDHSHPNAPGKWENDAMKRIFNMALDSLAESDSKMLIGCESAAGEPFIENLRFNDLRWFVGLNFSRPVPAYGYVFHEYINNFMGNQCGIMDIIDSDKSPDSLLFRIAYSFVAGDMLSAVLSDNGRITWGWCASWDTPVPDNDKVKKLIKNLSAWRREYPELLMCGKMIKPNDINCGEYILHRRVGTEIVYPSLFTSRFRSEDGREGQFIVNFSDKTEKCTLDCKEVQLIPGGEFSPYAGSLTVAPLSSVLVR